MKIHFCLMPLQIGDTHSGLNYMDDWFQVWGYVSILSGQAPKGRPTEMCRKLFYNRMLP